MPLSRGELNSLSVLGIRKLPFIPDHWGRIQANITIDVKLLDHWINFNLNSRYAIIKGIKVNNDKKMIEFLEIGIEDPKEITMLTLGCPYLHII